VSAAATTSLDVLVVTGGHPFEAEPFFAMFDATPGITWTGATAPESGHDAVVFYDIAGMRFTRSDPPTDAPAPTDEQVRVYDDLLDQGVGLVFLHHAIASWPAWPRFAEIVGGRFHYQPGTLRGVDYPDSGYVLDATFDVEVVAPEHPVCEGLPSRFTITDEPYCFPVFEDDVVPLMRTTFDVRDASLFFSPDHAIRGRRHSNEGWTHPPGSDLVGWVTSAERSPIVYLQFGDGPPSYGDANFRRALSNAIRWVASDDARRRAAQRGRSTR
jgi:type 1 glutamine amidotransferase